MSVRDEIISLNEVFKLKETYRFSRVHDRQESSAEHSWSCLVVADYLLSFVEADIDRLRVYELLMYHDLVEAECGDVAFFDEEARKDKSVIEQAAAKRLAKKLPSCVAEKFLSCFFEYEKALSLEARFAHLVDGFESDAFYGLYPSKKSIISSREYDNKRLGVFESFPELKEHYHELKQLRMQEGIIDE